MTEPRVRDVEFEDEAEEQDVAEQLKPGSVAAVVSGTDWTTETIVSQLKRGNIKLNPRFQRRDAWKRDRKSKFIESLIVGLPIPQIVLAESKDDRGTFIVLDGKQRLLSILQFWGLGDGPNNKYALSALTLRGDLKHKTFEQLSTDSSFEDDYNSLCNQSIRTVVIKNWKDSNFLHTVFLRLNTGSVKLSPQELRQALLPGPFSDYVDEAATKAKPLHELLGLNDADPRMRDTEILSRFLAFRFFADSYPGRMREFLDKSCDTFNSKWTGEKEGVESAVADFSKGIEALIKIFGDDVARKPDSRQFNRAIFDALIYFHSQKAVRLAVRDKSAQLRKAYRELLTSDSGFLQAVESDTAGAPNTSRRLSLWANVLSNVSGHKVHPPKIPVAPHQGNPPKKKAKKR
jgi:hypothetical protein